MRHSRRAGWLLLLAVAVVVGLILTREIWMGALGAFLVKAQPPFHADMIVVLGGDETGNRILKAGELSMAGYAPLILVSGHDRVYGWHESDLAVDYAVKHGFEEKRFIRFHYSALATRDEAKADIAEVRRRGAHSFILVTSDFHTRRAGSLFRGLAGGLDMRVVAAPYPHFRARWWEDRESRKTFLEEWIKLVANTLGM